MSANSRPFTLRTTSSSSTASARSLQRLLSRVRAALRRGNLSNRESAATPAIDDTHSNDTEALPVLLTPTTLLPDKSEQIRRGGEQSTTNPASTSYEERPPTRAQIEVYQDAVDSPITTDDSPTLSHALQNLLGEQTAARSQHHTTNSHLETLLTVDDDENIPDLIEESILPLGQLGRAPSGIAEAKARQLFERHGLTYHARPGAASSEEQDQEPAAKVRRVERSIRMRVRWTCHSCRTVFGQDKFCPGCGHRRCFECVRDPRRRVRVPAREEMIQEPELRLQLPASATALPTQHPHGRSELLQHSALHTHVDDYTSHGAEASPWRCTIQIGQPRPHATPSYDPANLPAHKRDCHQCESTTERIDQPDCSSCGHRYCILCPLYASNSSSNMLLKQTVPVVERVYRKPRQRVRFHCEHCDTQYTNRSHCAGCGHERCDNCPRFPPKKQKPSLDPLAWQALQAKLAARDNNPDSSLMTMENDTPSQEEPQRQARL